MRKIILIFLMSLIMTAPVGAQNALNPVERVVAMSTAGGLTIGAENMADNTLAIDYNPVDSQRHARIDGVGILRFIPAGGPEGVYTFAPLTVGHSAPDAYENNKWIQHVAWSPNGEMLAFIVDNPDDSRADLSHGVWFWQPAMDLPGDPSYQILRRCPPFCDATTAGAGQTWRALSVEWSTDNNAILIQMSLPAENRRGLAIRTAARDVNQQQAISAPDTIRYDYGAWTPDGQRIVVSGQDPNGAVIFGTIDRTGSNTDLTLASDIGMAWVQNAVQVTSDGRIVMLGSTLSRNAPLQLVGEGGTILTNPIGRTAPEYVAWSPDGTAVRLEFSDQIFVATIHGSVYDITELVGPSLAIDWIEGPLPIDIAALNLPQPVEFVSTTPDQTPTPDLITHLTPAVPQSYAVGDLLEVALPSVPIYPEPLADATPSGNLTQGEELIITGGPLDDGTTIWWRIQTLSFSGWVIGAIDGISVFQPVQGATG